MMRCIAIDDEPLALRQIVGYIGKTPFLELTAACRSALEAVEVLADRDTDLLFVDINMPDLNGLDFVRSLQNNPLAIFTTAYSEYALEGFRVNATDYLLKPIGYPDFLRSAEKAYRQFRLLSKESRPEESGLGHIFVKSDYKMVQVDVDDITYLESRGEYVRIYLGCGSPVMTLGSIRSYEESFPSDRFMRVHRSYIVNLRRIAAVERKHIILSGNIRIPIGESYNDHFREYLSRNSIIR